MIRQHDLNTRWWGTPTGIVDDAAFFALPDGERAQALAPYGWAEFKSGLAAAPPLAALARAGFFLADTQVTFRIALKDASSSCAENLAVCFADEPGFSYSPEDLAPFAHERYAHLPGQTPERLNARYAAWGGQLIRDYPETCLVVLSGGEVQGWFLS